MDNRDTVYVGSGEHPPPATKPRGRPRKSDANRTGSLRSLSMSSLPAEDEARDAKRARSLPDCMMCDKQLESLVINCAGCEGTVCAPCSKLPPQIAVVLQSGPIPGF